MDFFTIKELKRCLLSACIDGGIDAHFCDNHIVRPVLLVFIKQIYIKMSTNCVIYAFCLTIS